MKKIRGIRFGGLQMKIFCLILIFILALIGVYAAVTAYQRRNLTDIVQKTSVSQQESIETLSEESMRAVLEQSMTQISGLQAYIADDLFGDVREDVLTLQAIASELFEHRDRYPAHPFYPPDPKNDGIPTVQTQHEKGVDPASSEDLGLAANMSEIMLAMYENSGKLNSCFVATADGCILFADDRAGAYVTESGETDEIFPVRERPWYIQAAAEGEVIFTGVEPDAFTSILGLVCAAPVYRNGELVCVVGADVFLTSISDYVRDKSPEGGFLCVMNGDGRVLFSSRQEGVFREEISGTAPDLRESRDRDLAGFAEKALREQTGLTLLSVDGKEYYMAGAPIGTLGWAVLSGMDKEATRQPAKLMISRYDEINTGATDTYKAGAARASRTILVLTVVILILAVICALIMAGRVVRPLESMTKRIDALSGSDQVFEMEDTYRTHDEIEVLADSFTSLSRRTRDYIAQITQITAEKERVNAELSMATQIQEGMLPNIYPAYPERSEFDIYAAMDPAREVGGDFYDFFLVDDDHLCVAIADVSGKGVPAALFMMVSKIILQNNAMMGKSPAQILQDSNTAICSNNRMEMFVTVWLGILEISTGRLTYADGGHLKPLLFQDGGWRYVEKCGGVVLGMFDQEEIGAMDERYRIRDQEIRLSPGDMLFLYTDGVTEATDASLEQFGDSRLLSSVENAEGAGPDALLPHVRAAIDAFCGDTPQSDDITMLALRYNGGRPKQDNPV